MTAPDHPPQSLAAAQDADAVLDADEQDDAEMDHWLAHRDDPPSPEEEIFSAAWTWLDALHTVTAEHSGHHTDDHLRFTEMFPADEHLATRTAHDVLQLMKHVHAQTVLHATRIVTAQAAAEHGTGAPMTGAQLGAQLGALLDVTDGAARKIAARWCAERADTHRPTTEATS